MALKIRRVFVYVTISIIFFITIHHLILSPSSNLFFIPNYIIIQTQNDVVSEKLYQDNKIIITAQPIIDIKGTTVTNQTHTDDVTSSFISTDISSSASSGEFDHNDDVTSSFNYEHDVNSSNSATGFDNGDDKFPLTHGNSSVTNESENDDVTSSFISTEISSASSAEFDHNDDVITSTSSAVSTKFNEHDVNSSNFTTCFDNGDDKFPLTHGNASVSNESENDDVTSSFISTEISSASSAEFDHNDDVITSTSSVSTKFYEHDVNSSNSTTGFDNGDDKFPLTHGNASVTNESENDDVTSSFISTEISSASSAEFDHTDDVITSTSSAVSTKFNEHDVNSSNFTTCFDNGDDKFPLTHGNSSVSNESENDDVTSSFISTEISSASSAEFDHTDDVITSTSSVSTTKFNEHDGNSSNSTTGFGFDNGDDKFPLTHGNASVSNESENDDVTTSVRSTQFEDDHNAVNWPLNTQFHEVEFDHNDVKSPLVDVNSPLNAHIDHDQANSSIITDDVTSSVNSGTDDVTSSTDTQFRHLNSPDVDKFDSDDVNSALITQFDGRNVNNLPLITELDEVNSSISTQFHDHDDVTVSSSSQFDANDDVTLIANNVNVNVSVLFPAWEALVIVKSDDIEKNNESMSFYCLFDTNEVTKAKFAGTLSFSRETYTCRLPTRYRRRLPFRQPVLTNSKDDVWVTSASSPHELLRWNYIVYDVIDNVNDENDVVLLAKGINNRQGVDRSPRDFRCLFGDDLVKGVLTEVSSSLQEVFRCKRPDLSRLSAFGQSVVKASLVVVESSHVVPSIAYYEPRRSKVVIKEVGEKMLCACTMVYNVAKFLKEWVIYHANIGVDKFVLYDNGSDDDLDEVVKVLKSRGYDVEVRFWLWPKTQEAGYSHAAFVDKGACKWMMYIDVDEFVYSPKWKSLKPLKGLLPALLPSSPYGQVMIKCYEFGPSGQKKHPLTGVTQGYNCRKEIENRHKSIVLLDAVHESLLNMIHHFKLKDGYKSMKVELESVAVNHYKYQAWVEFKAKFRRRVSAYVVDWTRSVNLKSNDRAPGLGYSAVKPDGWEDRFCEVHDNRLRDLTRRWFGKRNGRSGVRMDWAK